MSGWRALVRGVRALARPGAADADADDEVRQFLDEAAADLEARGLPPAEARREAQRRWGPPMAIREEVRSAGWEHVVTTLGNDVRYGARRLRRSPGFTLVAITTLALGIGASTAIFSALHPILLAPLPYPGGDRIAMVLEDGRPDVGTFAMFRTLATRTHAFDALACLRSWQPAITGTVPERLDGQRVTSGYFTVLGVAPAIGRDFDRDDDRPRGPAVAIVADSLWKRRFGGDPAIVGRAIRLDDAPYIVIGVMPAGFENVLAPPAEIWTTLQYDPALPLHGREWGHHLRTVARLAAGETAGSATREAGDAARVMLVEQQPDTYSPDTRVTIAPLADVLVRGVRPVLLAMVAAVALVLLIACVNVTNLLLARGAQRRGEFALRAALGASRARLVRQMLTESVLLALLSAAAGIAVAAAGVRALAALAPPGLPRALAIAVDGQMLAFALAVSTLAGLVFGLLPALEAAGRDPHRDVRDASLRGARPHGRLRRVLVTAEVALAVVLLVGAGLLMRSVRRVLAVPLGFEPGDRLTLQVPLSGHRFDADGAVGRFSADALDAVRRVPGVTGAALTSQLPLSGDRDEYGAHFPADGGLPVETVPAFRYAVSPGYFAAIGTPVLRGRAIDDRDRRGAPLAAVISASLAQARFGPGDPIGRQLGLGPAGPFTIVGVAGDVHQVSLTVTDANAVYINADQSWFADRPMSFVIRTQGPPLALVPSLERAIWSVDPDQPIVRIATLASLVQASAAERRFARTVFEAFAAVALALAAIGIYGVLAGGVSERTREIGLRAALGATRTQIVALVLRQGLALILAGGLIGAAGAAAASRGLSALLFGISRLDPVTYAAVGVLLAVVSVAACLVPAWRAVHVDPSVALRTD